MSHGMFEGVIKLDTLNRTYYLRHVDIEEKYRWYDALSTTIDTQHQQDAIQVKITAVRDRTSSQISNLKSNFLSIHVLTLLVPDFWS